jgi:glyoxylase-like metal-dependent hydrolase (beta-lactamase superfamily II)
MIEVDRQPEPCDSGHMELLRWQVGDATVFRIADVDATAALQGLIPKFNSAAVSRAPWLTPNFVDGMGRLRGMVQAFLIMIDGQTIIVDPGVGNGKRRTAVPAWDNLRTDFLGRLQAAGVEPGGIDHVVNTHLHFDHAPTRTR